MLIGEICGDIRGGGVAGCRLNLGYFYHSLLALNLHTVTDELFLHCFTCIRYLEETVAQVSSPYTSTPSIVPTAIYEPAPYLDLTTLHPYEMTPPASHTTNHLTPLNGMSDIKEILAAQLDKITHRNFDQSFDRPSLKIQDGTLEGYQKQYRYQPHGTDDQEVRGTADYVRETLIQYEMSKPEAGILSGMYNMSTRVSFRIPVYHCSHI